MIILKWGRFLFEKGTVPILKSVPLGPGLFGTLSLLKFFRGAVSFKKINSEKDYSLYKSKIEIFRAFANPSTSKSAINFFPFSILEMSERLI